MQYLSRILTLSSICLSLSIVAGAQDNATSVQAKPEAAVAVAVAPSVPNGTDAPQFDAYTIDGKKVSLADYKGKVVILDFWASWCGPCQISMPGLEKIYQQIKSKNVVVLSLNTWDQKPDFEKWVHENSGTKYHFNFVRDPAEGDHAGIRKASIAKRLYKVIGIPTMYVIDGKGKVVGSFIGSGNEAKLVKTLAKVGVSANVPK